MGQAEEYRINLKSEQVVIDQARREGNTLHCATLMDLCHFKHTEVEKTYKNTKGRVVLRGDVAKDDSDSYVVFTEKGYSASHRQSPKFWMLFSDFLDVNQQVMQCRLGTSRLVRKLDQCVEIAGESARGWRQLPREHCDEPP